MKEKKNKNLTISKNQKQRLAGSAEEFAEIKKETCSFHNNSQGCSVFDEGEWCDATCEKT